MPHLEPFLPTVRLPLFGYVYYVQRNISSRRITKEHLRKSSLSGPEFLINTPDARPKSSVKTIGIKTWERRLQLCLRDDSLPPPPPSSGDLWNQKRPFLTRHKDRDMEIKFLEMFLVILKNEYSSLLGEKWQALYNLLYYKIFSSLEQRSRQCMCRTRKKSCNIVL